MPGRGHFDQISLHGAVRFSACEAADFLEFLQGGQLLKIFQAELDEEFFGRFIQDGLADDLFAAGGGDEFAIEQRLQNAGSLDAANIHNFGRGNRLFVGDHGEGFERGQGELDRRVEVPDEAAYGFVVFGLGRHAETAGDFADAQAALRAVVFGAELFENVRDPFAGLLGGLGNLIERERLIGYVDDGFEDGEELRIGDGDRGVGGVRLLGRFVAEDFFG